jgi:acyl dehydratase
MNPLILDSPDDLRHLVGQQIAKSDWFTITQDRIDAFAELTGDKQWIHVDASRAQRESPYRSTIAHGFLTLSLLSRMFQSAVQVNARGITINYGLNRVRFPSSVPVNSRLRAAFTVQSCKELPDSCEVVLSVVMERESSEKPCCVAEWVLRYYE